MRFNFSLAVLTVLLIGISFFASSCASKGITQPRSEIIAEAKSKGLNLPSIEEEREAFYAKEKAHQERLLALIKKRSGETFRDTDYRIGPGDEIEVNVFDVPEMDVTVRVRQSGFISLPLIGSVEAGGLGEREVHRSVRKKLARFVKDPQVALFISHYGSQKVAVMGAVQQPGTYPLKKGSNSLLQLFGQAGGLTESAGAFLNFVPSELSGLGISNEVEARARLALASFESDKLQDSAIEIYLDLVMGNDGGIPLEIPVRGGDMIIVPEAGSVTVEGEVQKVGIYQLGRKMSLLGSLAAAGGITYSAYVEEVEIVRGVGIEGRNRLVVDLQSIAMGEAKDVRLKSGDIIRVPSHSGRRITQDTFDGITQIINFGIGGTVNMVP